MMARPRFTALFSFLAAAALVVAASTTLPARALAADQQYDPSKIDWASVVDACAAAFRFERRLASFALRSAFHDAGSLTPECAMHSDAGTNPTNCGGADGSLLVSAAEQLHPNNAHELFAANTARFILPIAKRFGAGVADTLYVCALVAPAVLTSPSGSPSTKAVRDAPVMRAALEAGFRVGRVDRAGGPGNDPALLPVETLQLGDFTTWFADRGVDLEDAAALVGVHTLLRPKGCYVEDRIDAGTGLPRGCNPFVGGGGGPGQDKPLPGDAGPFKARAGSCPMVSMLRWSNEYFNDMCGVKGEGGFKITGADAATTPLGPGQKGFARQVADAVCGYRSDAFRADAVVRQQTGAFVTPPSHPSPEVIEWECPASGCKANPRIFPFVQNDAHLGQACRAGALLPASVEGGAAAALSEAAFANAPAGSEAGASSALEARALIASATLDPDSNADVELVKELRDHFIEYTGGAAGLRQWDLDFARAYSRMSELGAAWVGGGGGPDKKGFVPPVSLAEYCPSGWVHGRRASRSLGAMCARRCGQPKAKGGGGDCPEACRCATSDRAREAAVVPATGPYTKA